MIKYLVAIVLFASLLGCAQTQQWTLEASKTNLENAKISRQSVGEFMSTWSLNSGAIQCGTEEFIPAATLKDINRMDQLVKDQGVWSDEDYRKGCWMGIGTKLTAKQVEALIQWAIGMIRR